MTDLLNIPGYEILQTIGQGGMATVYRARHLALDREVALKVMSSALNIDPTFSERFVREAQIVARLSHPNIIQIYDVGHHGTTNYISMELITGHDLAYPGREGFSLEQTIHITNDLCKALYYAHSNNIIHLDIKPRNVLLRPDGSAVLMDFGIAKSAEADIEVTLPYVSFGRFPEDDIEVTLPYVGTPSYMSPEMFSGSSLDQRSDLYMLGVFFYKMLTGELPFGGDSPLAIAIEQLNQPIPNLAPEFEQFQPFLNTALAKSPEDRFTSAKEMANALLAIVNKGGETPVPPPAFTAPTQRSTPQQSAATSKRIISLGLRPFSWLITILMAPIAASSWIASGAGALFQKLKTPKKKALPETDGLGAEIVSDNPITSLKEDMLGFSDYAEAIAGVIDHPNVSTPLTIAINAKWGMGKTSLANLIVNKLTDKITDATEDNHVSCWFRAKSYSNKADLTKTFVGELARELHKRLPIYKQLLSPLPLVLCTATQVSRRRVLRLMLLIAISLLLITILEPVIKLHELTSGSLKFIDLSELSPALASLLVIMVGAYLLVKGITGTMETLANYVKTERGLGSAEANDQMRHELQRLVKKLKPKGGKFVLFIDDLERCRPSDAVSVFDLASQLLNFDEAVTVILTDINFMIDTYETDNKELAQNYLKNHQAEGDEVSYGRDYLHKLIQLQFDLPNHGDRIGNLTPSGSDPLAEPHQQTMLTHVQKVGEMTYAGVRQYMDEKIDDVGATVAITMPTEFNVKASQWGALQVERKQRFLGARSPLLKSASTEAMRYVRAVPRVVKRVHNHLCIMIFILHGRGLLSTHSDLRPEEVGKWVAMRECWPKTADKVIRHPQFLQRLELQAEKKLRSLTLAKEAVSPDSVDDEFERDLNPHELELLGFLTTAPLLSPVIEKLVNLE